MSLKASRKNIQLCRSRAVVIPAQLVIGEISTMACDRIAIIDFRGEISPEKLLDFLESEVEPRFWEWYKKQGEGKK